MKIMLPVDGSEASLDAVRRVLTLLHAGLRADVLLVNVQEPASLYEVVVAHDAGVIEQVSEAAAAHVIEPAQALLRAAGVTFEVEIGHGDPAHLIVDIAERSGCDLVVLGAHGQDAPARGALGSVATAVVSRSAAAVMVVKRAEAM
ncbi:MAG TPA: universal stress protein [Burkholderiaceae bacterium]|nr:universal stress protein [Burkholderiaceae bacterium]